MKIATILAFSFVIAQPMVSAETHENPHKHAAKAVKTKSGQILIKVNGMVCAFCAQGIEKNFNARKEVKSTKVNLDKMEVAVTLHKGRSLATSTIKEIVTSAGFSFEGMKE